MTTMISEVSTSQLTFHTIKNGMPSTKVGATDESQPPLKKATTGSAASHLTGFIGEPRSQVWLKVESVLVDHTLFILVNQTQRMVRSGAARVNPGDFPEVAGCNAGASGWALGWRQ
jgi:hypothetical protein